LPGYLKEPFGVAFISLVPIGPFKKFLKMQMNLSIKIWIGQQKALEKDQAPPPLQ
jgi:hypothetical protein